MRKVFKEKAESYREVSAFDVTRSRLEVWEREQSFDSFGVECTPAFREQDTDVPRKGECHSSVAPPPQRAVF